MATKSCTNYMVQRQICVTKFVLSVWMHTAGLLHDTSLNAYKAARRGSDSYQRHVSVQIGDDCQFAIFCLAVTIASNSGPVSEKFCLWPSPPPRRGESSRLRIGCKTAENRSHHYLPTHALVLPCNDIAIVLQVQVYAQQSASEHAWIHLAGLFHAPRPRILDPILSPFLLSIFLNFRQDKHNASCSASISEGQVPLPTSPHALSTVCWY